MSGKMKKQEKIEVFMSLNFFPLPSPDPNSVYVAKQQCKTGAVKTLNKKEFFIFYAIVNPDCDQIKLQEQVEKQILTTSIKDFIFIVLVQGQMGAGKIYSIFGRPYYLTSGTYCVLRGIFCSQKFRSSGRETDQIRARCFQRGISNKIDRLNCEKKNQKNLNDQKKEIIMEQLAEENLEIFFYSINKAQQINHGKKEEILKSNIEESRKKETVSQIIKEYEGMVKEVEQKFMTYIYQLEGMYQGLQNQIKIKDARIEQLLQNYQRVSEKSNQKIKKSGNILQLNEEFSEFDKKIRKCSIKKQTFFQDKQYQQYYQKLVKIKDQLEEDLSRYEKEKEFMENWGILAQKEIVSLLKENQSLKKEKEQILQQNRGLKRKVNEVLGIEEGEIEKQNSNSLWTNEESMEELVHLKFLLENNDDEKIVKQIEAGQRENKEQSDSMIKADKSHVKIKQKKEQLQSKKKEQEDYYIMKKLYYLEKLSSQKEQIVASEKSFSSESKFKEIEETLTSQLGKERDSSKERKSRKNILIF